MEIGRLVGFVLAVVAAALVIFAGRSCTKNISEINKKSRESNTSSTPSYHLITENYSDYGEFPSEEPHLIEETTERQYETVTNMFGEVVETIPITSPEEANMPVTTKSILDEYNDNHNGNSGEELQTTTRYVDIPEKITIHVG